MTDKDNKDKDNKDDTKKDEEEMSDKDVAAEATGDIFALLNDDAYKKIEAIYRQILYRSFYFPGGIPKKRIRGVGTDTAELEYDQDPTAFGSSGSWDPRYSDDYIERAKMEGFHKNFLYVVDGEVKTMSFHEAAQELRGCFQLGKFNTNNCDKSKVISIIVGLRYMNKIKPFLTEYGHEEDLNVTETDLKNLLTYAPQEVMKFEGVLQGTIGQTRSEFIGNNYGWVADEREHLAFDRGKFAASYMAEKKKFQEYADKLWGILQNVKALNLCANIDRSYNQGDNIKHEQKNTCALNIRNEMAAKNVGNNKGNDGKDDKDGTDGTDNKDGNGNAGKEKKEDTAKIEEEKKKLEEEKKKIEEERQALKSQVDDMKKQQQESENKSNQKMDDMMKKIEEMNKKQATPAPAPAPAPVQPKNNKTLIIGIVVASVVILLIFGIALFFALRKPKKNIDDDMMFNMPQNNVSMNNAQQQNNNTEQNNTQQQNTNNENVEFNTMNAPMNGGCDVILYE